MSDGPFIVSAGMVADVNFTGFSGQLGKSPLNVTQILPGGIVQLTGGGQFNLSGQLSSNQGSMQVDCIVGAAGGSQGLAYVVGNLGSVTLYIGMFLTGGTTPGFIIKDLNGTTIKTFSAGTFAAGNVLQLKLLWNSVTGNVSFFINGAAQAVTGGVAPWSPFSPVAVLYGSGANGFNSYVSFTGTFNKCQASNVGA